MPFPRWVAHLNKRVTNRFIEPIAGRAAGFAVVVHAGRVSGRRYRTPVNVFDADGKLIVALTYGPGADWFRNVRAGGGTIETRDGPIPIREVTLVGRELAWPRLPRLIRLALRVLRVTDFAVLDPSRSEQDQHDRQGQQ